ncbi:DUF7059 domain-containing protein [Brachybacterium fresconis]|uniref:Methylase of polypeptide subunit release factors n=1 Tax=Brachybacterium fresconis TaxID=173363 RepID=A0ABS4YJ83_9MICO|nr:methyltransferase [Brachybacterium fresconis]MBP2408831.1 methylase of polypeptide subunit release factors [Brachybacterium fresconis]
MSSDPPPVPPRALPALISALRSDLLAAPYTSAAIEALLGPVASAALARENAVPADRVTAALLDPPAVLLRLFTLGAVVPRSLVEAALPTLGVDGALHLGLLGPASLADPYGRDDHAADDPDTPLRALIDLAPYAASDDAGEISWWIASDLSELATGRALGPEHVLGVGGASLTLARITPREQVGTVLDLGCGGGIQAMHASRHADRVIATDLSARALDFAAFNAALNGIDLELRQGSLLDPVGEESFDLIISNPPFVITPRGRPHGGHGADGADGADGAGADGSGTATPRWTYRDGGRAGDTLLAELLTALPAHLAPGGRAVLLGNWEISPDAAWDEHPRSWLEPAAAGGVDAWVIQRDQEDPAQYAETWVRDGGVTDRDQRWSALVSAWLADFADRDVEAVGFGYLLLHRPDPGLSASRRGVLRTEVATGTGTGSPAAHLAAGLTALDVLAGLDDEALATRRLVRAEDVVERRHLTPGAWDPMLIELVQGAGLARVVRADQMLAATVGALDGTLTVGQVVAAVCALTDADPDEALEQVLPILRDLVLTSMVTL